MGRAELDKQLKAEPATQAELSLPAEQWRVLDQAHRKRNLAEYEGDVDIDQELLAALLRVASDVSARLHRLGPVVQGAAP
jgi:hypothetical protein